MSRSTTLAIVHPVDKLQGSDDAVRTQVWEETTHLLMGVVADEPPTGDILTMLILIFLNSTTIFCGTSHMSIQQQTVILFTHREVVPGNVPSVQ